MLPAAVGRMMARARPSKVVHVVASNRSSVEVRPLPSRRNPRTADLDGDQSVLVVRQVPVLVLELDGDIGEVSVVGTDVVPVGDDGQLEAVAGGCQDGAAVLLRRGRRWR